MSYHERMRTIEFCVEHVNGRVPVIAGSGSNATENAMTLSRDAERAGADGVAFTLHATSIDQLLDVADAGLLMPPKSTWFEPKLRSGIFMHRIA